MPRCWIALAWLSKILIRFDVVVHSYGHRLRLAPGHPVCTEQESTDAFADAGAGLGAIPSLMYARAQALVALPFVIPTSWRSMATRPVRAAYSTSWVRVSTES